MSFAMDATLCKNKIIMKTNFRESPAREQPPIHGLRGFKVHVLHPIWFIIFTDFSSLRLVYTCDKHKHEVTYAGAVN